MTQGLGKAAHACNSSSLKLKQEDLLEVKSRRGREGSSKDREHTLMNI